MAHYLHYADSSMDFPWASFLHILGDCLVL
jgi:hypothetical protein